MNQDIKSQLDRAKELLQDLKEACNNDLRSKEVSAKTRNLSQEVLLKIKHLLDQSIHNFFEKHYLSNLSNADKNSARVYFPILSKKENLRSVLGRAKMTNLETDYRDFYNFVDSVQPYNKNYEWLLHLANYASEKHIRLTPQIKTETKRVTISRGSGSVSWGQGVTFGSGVSVMSVPIDPITQMPVPNNIAETKIENWISFLFEGSDINVLWLCEKSVKDGEKIVKRIFDFV